MNLKCQYISVQAYDKLGGDVIKRIAKTNGNKLSHKQWLGLLANWHCQTMMFWDSFIFPVPNCQEGQLASVKGITPDLLYFFFLQTKFVKWSDMILSWWCVVVFPPSSTKHTDHLSLQNSSSIECLGLFHHLSIFNDSVVSAPLYGWNGVGDVGGDNCL